MPQPIRIFPGLSAKFGVTLTLDKANFDGTNWSTGEVFASVTVDTQDGQSKRLIGPASLTSNDTLEDGTSADWPNGFFVVAFTANQTATASVFTTRARLQIGLDDYSSPGGGAASTPWQSEQGFIHIVEAHV